MQWKVVIGAYDLDGDEYDQLDKENGDYDNEDAIITYDFDIKNFSDHPLYKDAVKYYDVAIIKLNTRVELGLLSNNKQTVNIICLPNKVKTMEI